MSEENTVSVIRDFVEAYARRDVEKTLSFRSIEKGGKPQGSAPRSTRKAIKHQSSRSRAEFDLKNCRLIGKITKVEGQCDAGHHVGEKFDLTLYSEKPSKSHRTPHVCGFLYDAMFPYLVALQFGAVFPWDKDKDKFLAGCPDNQNVQVEIRRIRT